MWTEKRLGLRSKLNLNRLIAAFATVYVGPKASDGSHAVDKVPHLSPVASPDRHFLAR